MASELSLDAVRDFIALNDGKVKNTTLVAHFKKFLNDPNSKAQARQKFKDFVNTVAVVKTESGEKYVQLKKKFRTAAPITAPALSAPEAPSQHSQQASPSHISSFDNPIVPENENKMNQDSAPPAVTDEEDYQAVTVVDENPMYTFGDPSEDAATPSQVDPVVPTAADSLDPPVVEIPTESDYPAPMMDPSGQFRVPFPPPERKNQGSISSSTSSQAAPLGAVEQARLNFQSKNETDDTASIMQSEASVDSNKENEFYDRGPASYSMDPMEKQWMLMAAKGNMLELRKLLNKDPNLAEKRDFVMGYTAMHWAAKKGDVDLVKMFGDAGVDINVMSNGGYTPLHLAAMQGHEKVVQVLVKEYEADTLIRNYSGRQARDYLPTGSISLPIQKLLFGNDGTGSVKDFAAGLRPRLDSVRKSKRLGNAISGGVGALGALVRGKSTSSEDVSSISSASPSLGRKGSFKSKSKKKSRKWSRDEKPSISLLTTADEVESGFGSRSSGSISLTSIHDMPNLRHAPSSSPNLSRPPSTHSRDSSFRPRGESAASRRHNPNGND